LKIVLENASDFKRCIDAVSVLIDEAEFVLNESGLAIKATDPSQISMVDFSLPKASFKEFDVSSETKIGLDLSYLSQVMSRAKASDALELSLEDDKSSIKVSFIGSSKRSFSLPVIDISSSDIPNPKIEFDASMVFQAGLLQDALKDSALITNHVSLEADPEGFYVKAKSSKGTVNSETLKSDKSVKSLEVKSETKSMFPLDYLQDMVKATSSGDEVSLEMKSNAPVKLSYKIGGAEITYFLAPRIESD